VTTELRQIATHVRSACAAGQRWMALLKPGGWCGWVMKSVRCRARETRTGCNAQCSRLGSVRGRWWLPLCELARVASSQKLKQSMKSLKVFAESLSLMKKPVFVNVACSSDEPHDRSKMLRRLATSAALHYHRGSHSARRGMSLDMSSWARFLADDFDRKEVRWLISQLNFLSQWPCVAVRMSGARAAVRRHTTIARQGCACAWLLSCMCICGNNQRTVTLVT
jgi:hypothetical protein